MKAGTLFEIDRTSAFPNTSAVRVDFSSRRKLSSIAHPDDMNVHPVLDSPSSPETDRYVGESGPYLSERYA